MKQDGVFSFPHLLYLSFLFSLLQEENLPLTHYSYAIKDWVIKKISLFQRCLTLNHLNDMNHYTEEWDPLRAYIKEPYFYPPLSIPPVLWDLFCLCFLGWKAVHIPYLPWSLSDNKNPPVTSSSTHSLSSIIILFNPLY